MEDPIKAKLDKMVALLKNAQQAIATLKSENEKVKAENASLMQRVRSLEEENARLREKHSSPAPETSLTRAEEAPPVHRPAPTMLTKAASVTLSAAASFARSATTLNVPLKLQPEPVIATAVESQKPKKSDSQPKTTASKSPAPVPVSVSISVPVTSSISAPAPAPAPAPASAPASAPVSVSPSKAISAPASAVPKSSKKPAKAAKTVSAGHAALPASALSTQGRTDPEQAQAVLAVLDDRNVHSAAKALVKIPAAVLRRCVLQHSLSLCSPAAVKAWLGERLSVAEDCTAIPALPAEAQQGAELVGKLLCALSLCGEMGHHAARECLARLRNHVVGSARSQQPLPWLSFFCGDSLEEQLAGLCAALRVPKAGLAVDEKTVSHSENGEQESTLDQDKATMKIDGDDKWDISDAHAERETEEDYAREGGEKTDAEAEKEKEKEKEKSLSSSRRSELLSMFNAFDSDEDDDDDEDEKEDDDDDEANNDRGESKGDNENDNDHDDQNTEHNEHEFDDENDTPRKRSLSESAAHIEEEEAMLAEAETAQVEEDGRDESSIARVRAAVQQHMFTRELSDMLLSLIVFQTAERMNGKELIDSFFRDLLFVSNIIVSPGALLAVLRCCRGKMWQDGGERFCTVLLACVQHCELYERQSRVLNRSFPSLSALDREKRISALAWLDACAKRLRGAVNRELLRLSVPVEIEQSFPRALEDESGAYSCSALQSVLWRRRGWNDACSALFRQRGAQSTGLASLAIPFETLQRTMREVVLENAVINAEIAALLSVSVVPHLMTDDSLAVCSALTVEETTHAFQRRWSNALSLTQLENTQYIDDLRCFYDDFSHSLLVPALQFFEDGGWRGGATGEGIRLAVSLQTRLQIAQDHLSKLSLLCRTSRWEKREHAALTMEAQQLFNYSTCDVALLSQTMRLVDHCSQHVFAATASDSLYRAEQPEVSLLRQKLRKVCAELLGLISLAFVERLVFAVSCSARALLQHVLHSVRSPSLCHNAGVYRSSTFSSLINAAEELLVCSAPMLCGWSDGSLCSLLADVRDELRVSPGPLWEVSLSRALEARLPGFVINLDRRMDRWKRFYIQADKSGLSLMRVSAVDGELVSEGKTVIPESDVALSWNTTLNSKFDRHCDANAVVALTPSERACAASHLKVWREIMNIRAEWKKKHDNRCVSSGVREFRHFIDTNLVLPGQLLAQQQLSHPDTDVHLVFEDDADIKSYEMPRFRAEILHILRKAASLEWDIIYLGGVMPLKSPACKSSVLKNGFFVKPNYVWMLHAYLIKGSAVEKIMSFLPIVGPVDNFIATLIYDDTLKALCLGDFIVNQCGGNVSDRLRDSDIVRSAVSSSNLRGYRLGYQQKANRKRPQEDNDNDANFKRKKLQPEQ